MGALVEVDSNKAGSAGVAATVTPSMMPAGSVKSLVTVWSPAIHRLESASKLSAWDNIEQTLLRTSCRGLLRMNYDTNQWYLNPQMKVGKTDVKGAMNRVYEWGSTFVEWVIAKTRRGFLALFVSIRRTLFVKPSNANKPFPIQRLFHLSITAKYLKTQRSYGV